MLKKSKKKNKMKLRSGNKSRKVKKGGTVYKGTVGVPVPATSSKLTSVSEDGMTDIAASVVNNAPASVLNNNVAEKVNKFMTLRKREHVKHEESYKPKTVSKKSNYDIWLEMADNQFTKKEYEEYRKKVGNCQFKLKVGDHELKYEELDETTLDKIHNKKMSSLGCQEQYWAIKNIDVISQYMGLEELWEIMVPNVDVKRMSSIRSLPKSDRPIAVFTKTSNHWTSRRANEKHDFNPYYKYQIFGSNQFCQTYAMMYLLNKLDLPSNIEKIANVSFNSYYEYTKKALNFINDNAIKHVDVVMEKINGKIDELIKLIDNNVLNDENKDNKETKEIKLRIKDYIIDDEKDDEFNERYKTLAVEEIKQNLIDNQYDKEYYKNKLNKAIKECIKHSNLCLNAIDYTDKINFLVDSYPKITH